MAYPKVLDVVTRPRGRRGYCSHAGNGSYFRQHFVPGRGQRIIWACFWCALLSADYYFASAGGVR